MDDHELNARLSQMSTCWTLLAQTQAGTAGSEILAQAALLERYQRPVYRYLLGATRDPDNADELFQEFALRFVRGGFRNVQAGRGRFRDYVKTALINLVISSNRKKARTTPAALENPEAIAADPEGIDLDQEFLAGWRKALLDRAWEGLATLQKPGGPPFHDALHLRTHHADLSSSGLAAELTRRLQPGTPFTDAGVRKIIQRAREMFAELLVDEVSRSLHWPSTEQLEQEIIDLGFQPFCRKILDRRRGGETE